MSILTRIGGGGLFINDLAHFLAVSLNRYFTKILHSLVGPLPISAQFSVTPAQIQRWPESEFGLGKNGRTQQEIWGIAFSIP